MFNSNYFVYITTNPGKTTFYTGVTNDLERRMSEHKANKGKHGTFAGQHYCYNLVYFERHWSINQAIAREKEIKLMRRDTKLELIKDSNPKLRVLKLF
ncbi:MAG: GIY-YIG nuclease family protein [Bacteroidota bacterium]